MAIATVCCRNSFCISADRLNGGKERPESPVHACLLDVFHDAADNHLLAIDTASTSTSIASFRKRSIKIGIRSGQLYDIASASRMERSRSACAWMISIARPPSTLEGRITSG